MTCDIESGGERVVVAGDVETADVIVDEAPARDDPVLAAIRAECLKLAEGDVGRALDVACGMLLSRLAATSYGFGRGETEFMRLMRKMQHTD